VTTPTSESKPARFDSFAGLYDRYAAIMADWYRPWIASHLPAKGARGLDAGCGAGRFTSLLAERCIEVLGVDIAPNMLSIARTIRAMPNVRYEHRSLLDVDPEKDGLFDIVMSVNTLNHLTDRVAALRHLHSLIAPGGSALIIDIVTSPSSEWGGPRRQAVTDAARELIHRRSLGDARMVYRLRTHPDWIKHVSTVRMLTREEFRTVYGEIFPGAQFSDDGLYHRAYAMLWRRSKIDSPR